MSEHLTEAQISAWLAGVAGAREAEHLAACPRCSGSVSQMEQALAGFKSSVTAWTEEQATAPLEHVEQGRFRGAWGRVFGLAFALSLALAVFTFSSRWREPNMPRNARGDMDGLLLEQVNAAVARHVPSHMEPLRQLVPEKLHSVPGDSPE